MARRGSKKKMTIPSVDAQGVSSRKKTSAKKASAKKAADKKGAATAAAKKPKRGKAQKKSAAAKPAADKAAAKPIKGKRKSIAKQAAKQVAKEGAGKIAEPKDKRTSTRGIAKKASSRTTHVSADGTAGKRVGDLRARQREERNRSRYRSYILRIVLVIAIVLGVIFGSIFLYRSDAFHVNNVKINGVSHLSNDEVTSIAAVPDDSTLLRLDTAGIIERLESNAWVQEATISRKLPDTIEINVTERAPGAVVRINDKTTWVISEDGIWLSVATKEDWETQMRIVDVSTALSQPVSGGDCNDGGIMNALAILDGISEELRAKIKSISAESSIKTSLNLDDGITVAFGDSSDIELKEAAINALLSKYKGKISYINVRVPSRPTYRTLGAAATE